MSISTAYFDVDGTLVGTNLLHPTVMYFANQASPAQTASRFGRALLQAPAMLLAAPKLKPKPVSPPKSVPIFFCQPNFI